RAPKGPGTASVPVARRDDVGLDGVVGRVRRSAHGDGPFEPGSGGGIGTIAPRCQDDGALLLLGTVAGGARSVAAGGGVEFDGELPRRRITSLELEAARAGESRRTIRRRE